MRPTTYPWPFELPPDCKTEPNADTSLFVGTMESLRHSYPTFRVERDELTPYERAIYGTD